MASAHDVICEQYLRPSQWNVGERAGGAATGVGRAADSDVTGGAEADARGAMRLYA